MPGQPYTECKLYVDGIPGLQEGDYLRTRGGSAYFVTSIRQSRSRPYRRNLRALRWPVEEILPQATVHQLHWYPRRKKTVRRLG